MPITFRPVAVPDDFERLAAIASQSSTRPITAAQLTEWEWQLPPGTVRERLCAIDERGAVAGYSLCERVPFMLPGNYYVDVHVDRAAQRRGVGARLLAEAEHFAVAHGATRLESEVSDIDPAWQAFAARRGFTVDRRIFESRLDLAAFDERPFVGVVEAAQAGGIRFFALAEAGNTEANRRRLFALSHACAQDIPGREPINMTFEDMDRLGYQTSFFRPDGVWLAADGDTWVGQTVISYYAETNSTYTQHTGVLRAYRERRIALALKLLGIRWSRSIGAAHTRTHNDSQNTPILAINRALGFQPLPGYARMLKAVNSGQ
ncbi:MAG: GNAT family N-acetyltransferase [Chloroflexi bacterium]|nr:GNAT family N-acetyltransferase [Chloroflexota bacterium]